MADMSAKAVIEDGAIVIRVPLANLQTAIDGAYYLNYLDTRWLITNVDEFADDLAVALNSEDEQGTTRIHRLFDKGVTEALEQGAFGIEEHPQQEI